MIPQYIQGKSKGYIVESGSNSNGNYIKFSDGTMICTKTVLFENVAITNAWGSFFESKALSLGDYAKPFIKEPDISLTSHRPNFVEKEGDVSLTNFGTFYACKPKSTSSEIVKVSCVAIGKWK